MRNAILGNNLKPYHTNVLLGLLSEDQEFLEHQGGYPEVGLLRDKFKSIEPRDLDYQGKRVNPPYRASN